MKRPKLSSETARRAAPLLRAYVARALAKVRLSKNRAQMDKMTEVTKGLQERVATATQPILANVVGSVLETVQQRLDEAMRPLRDQLQQRMAETLKPVREQLQHEIDQAMQPVRQQLQQQLAQALSPVQELLRQQLEGAAKSPPSPPS